MAGRPSWGDAGREAGALGCHGIQVRRPHPTPLEATAVTTVLIGADQQDVLAAPCLAHSSLRLDAGTPDCRLPLPDLGDQHGTVLSRAGAGAGVVDARLLQLLAHIG